MSVFGAEDTTLNSETTLNVAINEHFGLKVGYNLTWNSQPPESAPEHTDRRTTVTLGYKMQYCTGLHYVTRLFRGDASEEEGDVAVDIRIVVSGAKFRRDFV